MTDSRATELMKEAEALFAARSSLLSLWQEVAFNFYVERADFTTERTIGTTFAENLMTSYPVVARRTLGDNFSSMLRPTAKEWFKTTVAREDRLDDDGRRWLAYATDVQRRAMYDRTSGFHRATKEGDHDFAAFGQCVLSVELNRRKDALLYRSWHLRDVAWCENAEGKIDTIHRKWKLYAKDAVRLFPKIGGTIKKLAETKPYDMVTLRHCVKPADDYQTGTGDGPRKRYTKPYVSVYYTEDGEICEEMPSQTLIYVIPRWQTVSGSQYAYSPATVAALPDARLIQAITLTLLEAGERMTNPPMLAVQEAIRGDLQVYAGGVTWVDAEYDERLGEVLRPLTQDKSGMPLGRDMRNDVKEAISECFYLNKLGLPPTDPTNKEMTAFEVGQRVQEYIRNALPLFEPMEQDYNGALCEQTFEVLLYNNGFGTSENPLPQSLSGQEIQFRFESPLSEAIEAQKATKLIEAKQILAAVVDLDPSAGRMLDAKTALRDALIGKGVPPTWLLSPEQLQAAADHDAQMAHADQVLSGMERASGIAKNLATVPMPDEQGAAA